MEQNNIYDLVFKVNHAGGSGSCFYFKKYNLFVTNYHVVEGYRKVAICDKNRNPFLANVVLVNPLLDIALLHADGDFTLLPEITLSQAEDISVGQKINVAGYPLNMPFTVTEGTVSAPKQLMNNAYYVQTDAAVNPGNSGGPMFNENGELIAITVSKIKDADNMGFGIPVVSLLKLLENVDGLDKSTYNVQCGSCEDIIGEDTEYCSSCGDKLPENVFKERGLTNLALFCEKAILAMGLNPILARIGHENWKFHKGSSEIRMFIYNRSFLYCTSPLNTLPKKDLEPLLTHLVQADVSPYQLGLYANQIYISYRIHISDIVSEHADEINKNITNLAFKADELDNYFLDTYGAEMTEYAKKDA